MRLPDEIISVCITIGLHAREADLPRPLSLHEEAALAKPHAEDTPYILWQSARHILLIV